MLNQVSARVSRAACASFDVACVFALLTACGAEPEPQPEPVAGTVSHASMATQSPTSTEELIFLSEIVARARLVSVDPGSRLYRDGQQRPVFVFRFRVVEYLKGSGEDDLTVNLIAESPDGPFAGYHYTGATPMPTPDAEEALRTAKSRLAQRDARWDNREALIFLNPSTIPGESGAYEFAGRYSTTVLYNYAITSEYNRAWLPATAPSGDAAADAAIDSALASSEPHYLTGEPFDMAQPQAQGAVAESVSPPESSAAAISLSGIKSLIKANESMQEKGEGIPGYDECVKDKFKYDSLYKEFPPQMSFLERHISSGRHAGHRLWPNPRRSRLGELYYERWWTAGPDSDLFAHRIIDDPDNDPATGYATEHVTLRPIPKGEYKVFVNDQPVPWQGNRILLSESEYRSQVLQVPARSLALSRHPDFQRLLPLRQIQRQSPKRRHVLRRVSDPDHAPVLPEWRAGVRLRPFSTPQCSLTAPRILSARAGRLDMKYRL